MISLSTSNGYRCKYRLCQLLHFETWGFWNMNFHLWFSLIDLRVNINLTDNPRAEQYNRTFSALCTGVPASVCKLSRSEHNNQRTRPFFVRNAEEIVRSS